MRPLYPLPYSMLETRDIQIRVQSDTEGVEKISWRADDAGQPDFQDAHAFILALWDASNREALRIDLWTKELTVDDMNDFFFRTLMTMADTYKSATQNNILAADMKIFAQDFARKAAEHQRKLHGFDN